MEIRVVVKGVSFVGAGTA